MGCGDGGVRPPPSLGPMSVSWYMKVIRLHSIWPLRSIVYVQASRPPPEPSERWPPCIVMPSAPLSMMMPLAEE